MTVNDYITVADLKAAMPDQDWSSGIYDTQLASLATTASRVIDRYTGWQPGAFSVTDDEVRYFDGSETRRIWTDPLCAVPTAIAMTLTGDPLNYTDIPQLRVDNNEPNWWPLPYNALLSINPYYTHVDFNILWGSYFTWYGFPRAVKVTGKFGFSTSVPEEIKWAATIQGIRSWKRAQQAFGDTGGIIDLGKLTYTKSIDPEVCEILSMRFQRGPAV